MECGGKRSATPLCNGAPMGGVVYCGRRIEARRSVPVLTLPNFNLRQMISRSKAPSTLRSAGALQRCDAAA
jgi:hypothetical protein